MMPWFFRSVFSFTILCHVFRTSTKFQVAFVVHCLDRNELDEVPRRGSMVNKSQRYCLIDHLHMLIVPLVYLGQAHPCGVAFPFLDVDGWVHV